MHHSSDRQTDRQTHQLDWQSHNLLLGLMIHGIMTNADNATAHLNSYLSALRRTPEHALHSVQHFMSNSWELLDRWGSQLLSYVRPSTRVTKTQITTEKLLSLPNFQYCYERKISKKPSDQQHCTTTVRSETSMRPVWSWCYAIRKGVWPDRKVHQHPKCLHKETSQDQPDPQKIGRLNKCVHLTKIEK